MPEFETLRLRNLCPVPMLNEARLSRDNDTDATRKETRKNLATLGWLQDGNGVIIADKASNTWSVDQACVDRFAKAGIVITKQLQLKQLAELHAKYLERQWAYHKEAKDRDPGTSDKPSRAAVELRIFEWLYVEKDKIVKPTHIPITGNRRLGESFQALVDRYYLKVPEGEKLANGKVSTGEETYGFEGLIDTVPCEVADLANHSVRLTKQFLENSFKKKGFVPGSPIDDLLSAEIFCNQGMTQIRLREISSSPTIGVKNFCLIALDRKFPALGIIKRCCITDPNDPNRIAIQSVDHSVLQGFKARFTAESTAAYNEKGSTKGGPYNVLTQEEVKAYFGGGYLNKSRSAKMMDKTKVENLGTTFDNPFVRSAFNAVKANETKELESALEMSGACKALVTLHGDGDYPHAEKILVALASAPKGETRNKLEERLLKVIS